jgi:hypothetical protein
MSLDSQNSPTEQVEQTVPVKDSGETSSVSDTLENTAEDTTSEVTDAGSNSENENNTDDESSESGEDGKKKSGGFEKRIERFNRRLAEKEAEIEHWRKAALQSGNQTPQQQTTPVVATDKPKFADFNDIETYTEAVTEWKLEQREAVQRQQSVVKTYQEKEQAVRAANPDYDEVMSDFKDRYKHVNAPEVNQFLAESDKGAEMFYHLANNTAEVDRILALSPLRRVAELGKLEAKLSTVGSVDNKVVNKVSKAPKPVTKETGVAPVIKRLEDPNLSQAEWRQLRMATKKRY